jgi:hypothetical protein
MGENQINSLQHAVRDLWEQVWLGVENARLRKLLRQSGDAQSIASANRAELHPVDLDGDSIAEQYILVRDNPYWEDGFLFRLDDGILLETGIHHEIISQYVSTLETYEKDGQLMKEIFRPNPGHFY